MEQRSNIDFLSNLSWISMLGLIGFVWRYSMLIIKSMHEGFFGNLLVKA